MAIPPEPAPSAGAQPASKPNWSGLQPGERRLYLVNTSVDRHGKPTIIAYHGVLESPDAIVDKDWTVELARLAAAGGPPVFTGVEIHCHGQPAEIRLVPKVTMDNVEQFGALLARLVKPGSLIEVLACKVSSFPVERILAQLQGYEDRPDRDDERYGPPSVTLDRWWADKDIVAGRSTKWFGPRLRQAIEVFRPFMTSGLYRFRENRQTMRWDRPPTHPKLAWEAMFAVGDEVEGVLFDKGLNGPRFCKLLAKASGCSVRAAWISQAQERDQIDDQWVGPFESLVGDWEGYVFDYDPSGSLKEVHFALERPVSTQATWVASAIVPCGRWGPELHGDDDGSGTFDRYQRLA